VIIDSNWFPILFNAGVLLVSGGGLTLYCRAIDKRNTRIEDKIDTMSTDYVQKSDCSEYRGNVQETLLEQRKTLDIINIKIGYLQGLNNGHA